MSKRSNQKRAQRRRTEAARRRARSHQSDRSRVSASSHEGVRHTGDGRERPSDAIDRLVSALRSTRWDDLVGAIHDLDDAGLADADELIRTAIRNSLVPLWDSGWRPSTLVRYVQRREADLAEPLRREVVAQADEYRGLGERVAPDWMAEVDALGTPRRPSPDRRHLLLAATAFRLMFALPRLPLLGPPPSQWSSSMSVRSTGDVDESVLARVRALLAKAESTEFDEEADAFTAKAQELMTRHRIDRARLEASTDAGPEVAGRRIDIDNPYPEAKAMLLSVVAEANGGRAVWEKDGGWSTVFADPVDLAVIDALFTSLLLQATAALRREGSRRNGPGGGRTTRFRRSFLAAYATRIGQRLREAADVTVAAADTESGGTLVPVLARKEQAADDARARAFPDTGTFSVSATDGEGWYKGVHHADRADMSAGAGLRR